MVARSLARAAASCIGRFHYRWSIKAPEFIDGGAVRKEIAYLTGTIPEGQIEAHEYRYQRGITLWRKVVKVAKGELILFGKDVP
jgi:hypothetical protein